MRSTLSLSGFDEIKRITATEHGKVNLDNMLYEGEAASSDFGSDVEEAEIAFPDISTYYMPGTRRTLAWLLKSSLHV